MPVFIDTSALLAFLDASDQRHSDALSAWDQSVADHVDLVTTNYVLLETSALVGRRLGFRAVRDLQRDLVPTLRIVWVAAELHQSAMSALLTAGTRDLSMVDCVSFEAMRREGIETAFAYDRHFTLQGFTCLG